MSGREPPTLESVARRLDAFQFSTVANARGHDAALQELCALKRDARAALVLAPGADEEARRAVALLVRGGYVKVGSPGTLVVTARGGDAFGNPVKLDIPDGV